MYGAVRLRSRRCHQKLEANIFPVAAYARARRGVAIPRRRVDPAYRAKGGSPLGHGLARAHYGLGLGVEATLGGRIG
jgi:hypothetical protein